MKVFILFAVLLFFSACSYSQPTQDMSVLTSSTTVKEQATKAPNHTPKISSTFTPSPITTPFERTNVMDNPSIVIKKSERMLYVYDGDCLCAKVEIALSSVPIGHKQKEGDKKVPEGKYYICTKNDKSKYYLALAISYPNIQDAKVGLDSGLISQQTYERIEEAISKGLRPPWNTALGGEIMIHGSDISKDWTAGCIAAENHDIDYLWENCPVGTPITILP